MAERSPGLGAQGVLFASAVPSSSMQTPLSRSAEVSIGIVLVAIGAFMHLARWARWQAVRKA